MDVSIVPHLQRFVDDEIRAGRYATPDEVINSALAHLAIHNQFSADEIEELKSELSIGVEQADRGEFADFSAEDITREGRELLRQKKAV